MKKQKNALAAFPIICQKVQCRLSSCHLHDYINEKTLSMKNHARKKQEVKLRLRNLAMLPSYFDYIFVHLGPKARLRPKIFVNFRPEPDPKSPA